MLEDEFGDIIGKARNGLKLSLEEVAGQAAMPPEELRGLEACQSSPGDEQVRALAGVLQLNEPRLLAIARGLYAPAPVDAARWPQVAEITGYIGSYPVHAYLLACLRSKRAAAIDTADNPSGVLQAAQARGWQIDTILVTHTHPDHIGGIEALRQGSGARIVVHEQERGAVAALWDEGRDLALGAAGEVQVGDLTIRGQHTPGHTAGSLTYTTAGLVFVGDTLFAGSVGRANFRYDLLLASIREQILTLEESTLIFPGHGPASTVGEERRHNAFFFS